ncbi:hypothetical protein HN803_08050 [candidate division WWE3 bacterium]|jgi:prolipoprotein diacylglyceryltransferase|nr:hypothetical protein [candidate division WWE3 bacterium]MBT7350705.1 hypothetical protein [candidate division WWE3 bacterium]
MNALPATINIANLSFHTYGIFILFGFLLFTFVIWSEGKKDGFNEEKLFDLILITIVSSILFSRAAGIWGTTTSAGEYFTKFYQVWNPGYNFLGAMFGFLFPIYVLTKVWKWSFYRIVDIFALGASLGFSVILLGFVGLQQRFEFLFGFAAWIFLYALIANIRNKKIKSGYGFSLFLLVNTLLGLVFFRDPSNLIFYVSLVTLATAVFIFRWRKTNYDTKLITRIIERVKEFPRRKKD